MAIDWRVEGACKAALYALAVKDKVNLHALDGRLKRFCQVAVFWGGEWWKLLQPNACPQIEKHCGVV